MGKEAKNIKKYETIWEAPTFKCDVARACFKEGNVLEVRVHFFEENMDRIFVFRDVECYLAAHEGLILDNTGDAPGTAGSLLKFPKSRLRTWLNQTYENRISAGKKPEESCLQVSTDNETVLIIGPSTFELRESFDKDCFYCKGKHQLKD